MGCYERPATPVGWNSLGDPESLGVFVMATESWLLRNIYAENIQAVGIDRFLNVTKPISNSIAVG